MTSLNDVSVVVPVLDAGPALLDTIEGVAGCGEVILVDNASVDDAPKQTQERFASVTVLTNPSNVGFAPACNQGVAAASRRYVLLLNSDAVISGDGVKALVEAAEDDPAGAIWQPILRQPGGEIENAGESFTWSGFPVRRREIARTDECRYSVFATTAACLLVRREVFLGLGGLVDGYFAYSEDVDLCWRARLAGWEVRVVPNVDVFHRKHETTKRILQPHEVRSLTFRNRLRTILADGSLSTVARVLPVHVAGCFVAAGALLLSGRPRSAWSVVRALAWPVVHLSEMGQQRRGAQALRRRPDREVLRPELVVPFLGSGAWRSLLDHLRRWGR